MDNKWLARILMQLGKESPVIKPAGSLYVLVHPFLPLSPKSCAEPQHKNPAYLDTILALIRTSKEPILTLDNELEATMTEYAKLSPEGDRFFMVTGATAEPVCGWRTVAEMIGAFRPSETIFGGAYLLVRGDNYTLGVGNAYNKLKALIPNPRIDLSLCDIVE